MADHSAIQWTEASWTVVTGCDKVSPGCTHCYALAMAKRLKAAGDPHYQTDGDPRTSGPGFGVAWHWDRLIWPHQWRKPRRVFVTSMGDLFHEQVPEEFIVAVFAVMAHTPQHTYQVLTKRPARMAQVLGADDFSDRVCRRANWNPNIWSWPRRNVWLGTSVESQYWVDRRVDELLRAPAWIRFLSCEPLLGPIDLGLRTLRAEGSELYTRADYLHWIIAGGESGPRHRPMDLDWIRSLRDQCLSADVAFFYKQAGGANPKSGGRELDGRTWDEFPLSSQPPAGGPAYDVAESAEVDRAKHAAPASAGIGNDAGAVIHPAGREAWP